MNVAAGSYALGPDSAQLTVLTGTSGPASRLGHNLEIAVDQWQATLQLSDDPAGSKLSFKAEASSLRVVGGRGSLQPLSDNDSGTIKRAIDEKVLKRSVVRFNSSSVMADDDGRLQIQGALTLLGTARPLRFEITIDQAGQLSGEAQLKQSDWGIKPYGVMAGALKVADKLRVTVNGELPEPA